MPLLPDTPASGCTATQGDARWLWPTCGSHAPDHQGRSRALPARACCPGCTQQGAWGREAGRRGVGFEWGFEVSAGVETEALRKVRRRLAQGSSDTPRQAGPVSGSSPGGIAPQTWTGSCGIDCPRLPRGGLGPDRMHGPTESPPSARQRSSHGTAGALGKLPGISSRLPDRSTTHLGQWREHSPASMFQVFKVERRMRGAMS
jgi:hypothetical protein